MVDLKLSKVQPFLDISKRVFTATNMICIDIYLHFCIGLYFGASSALCWLTLPVFCFHALNLPYTRLPMVLWDMGCFIGEIQDYAPVDRQMLWEERLPWYEIECSYWKSNLMLSQLSLISVTLIFYFPEILFFLLFPSLLSPSFFPLLTSSLLHLTKLSPGHYLSNHWDDHCNSKNISKPWGHSCALTWSFYTWTITRYTRSIHSVGAYFKDFWAG